MNEFCYLHQHEVLTSKKALLVTRCTRLRCDTWGRCGRETSARTEIQYMALLDGVTTHDHPVTHRVPQLSCR